MSKIELVRKLKKKQIGKLYTLTVPCSLSIFREK